MKTKDVTNYLFPKKKRKYSSNRVIKKCFPKKGIRIELQEEYWREGCPKRFWKLYLYIENYDTLEVTGLICNKQEAINNYINLRNLVKTKAKRK